MDFFLKTAVVFMLVFLIIMQLLLISPYAAKIFYDDLNGSPILSYQSTVHEGFITFELLGQYPTNSAVLMINGEHVMNIDRFPVRIRLTDGDVVEIWTANGTSPFYVYIAERDGILSTDLNESTIKIVPGVNRILRAIIRQ